MLRERHSNPRLTAMLWLSPSLVAAQARRLPLPDAADSRAFFERGVEMAMGNNFWLLGVLALFVAGTLALLAIMVLGNWRQGENFSRRVEAMGGKQIALRLRQLDQTYGEKYLELEKALVAKAGDLAASVQQDLQALARAEFRKLEEGLVQAQARMHARLREGEKDLGKRMDAALAKVEELERVQGQESRQALARLGLVEKRLFKFQLKTVEQQLDASFQDDSQINALIYELVDLGSLCLTGGFQFFLPKVLQLLAGAVGAIHTVDGYQQGNLEGFLRQVPPSYRDLVERIQSQAEEKSTGKPEAPPDARQGLRDFA